MTEPNSMTQRLPADQGETPEDVATLYSWANLHGAKYRDFSASRAQAREEARLRVEEAQAIERQRLTEEAERVAQEEAQLAARLAAEAAEAAREAEAERLAEIARQAEAERQAVLAAQEAQRQALLQRAWQPPSAEPSSVTPERTFATQPAPPAGLEPQSAPMTPSFSPVEDQFLHAASRVPFAPAYTAFEANVRNDFENQYDQPQPPATWAGSAATFEAPEAAQAAIQQTPYQQAITPYPYHQAPVAESASSYSSSYPPSYLSNPNNPSPPPSTPERYQPYSFEPTAFEAQSFAAPNFAVPSFEAARYQPQPVEAPQPAAHAYPAPSYPMHPTPAPKQTPAQQPFAQNPGASTYAASLPPYSAAQPEPYGFSPWQSQPPSSPASQTPQDLREQREAFPRPAWLGQDMPEQKVAAKENPGPNSFVSPRASAPAPTNGIPPLAPASLQAQYSAGTMPHSSNPSNAQSQPIQAAQPARFRQPAQSVQPAPPAPSVRPTPHAEAYPPRATKPIAHEPTQPSTSFNQPYIPQFPDRPPVFPQAMPQANIHVHNPIPAPPPYPTPQDPHLNSRDRNTNRWYALKSVFDPHPSAEQAPAQPTARVPALAVFSLAGGVGKTSIVAALGRALSSRGERVLLVDTATYGLLPFFFGARDQRPGMLRTFNPPGIAAEAPVQLVTLDPEGPAPESHNQDQGQFRHEQQDPNYDWLTQDVIRSSRGSSRMVIDLPTASGATTRRILKLSPVVLVPVVPDMSSVVSVGAIESFFRHSVPAPGAGSQPIMPFYVLNQFDYSLPLHLDVREILREQIGDRLLPFALRRNPAVSEALAEGMTVIDYAPTTDVAEDYASLAAWARTLSAPANVSNRGVRWSER